MLKKQLFIMLAAAGVASFAQAANVVCDPPVVTVSSTTESSVSRYTVECTAGAFLTVTPKITFRGTLDAKGTTPYAVKARYTVDVRDDLGRKLNEAPRADQLLQGALVSATESVAGLGNQFAQQTHWDPAGVLSVEEGSGKWRIFSVTGEQRSDGVTSSGDEAVVLDVGATDAGIAHSPFKGGRAVFRVVLGDKFSRFSDRAGASLPIVNASLGLREGKLEMLVGASRVANHQGVQNALLRLDRQPKDIARAWNLAARAQFLGLEDEVRYAEQKVAAHHPELLSEFQQAVKRITPFSVPAAE